MSELDGNSDQASNGLKEGLGPLFLFTPLKLPSEAGASETTKGEKTPKKGPVHPNDDQEAEHKKPRRVGKYIQTTTRFLRGFIASDAGNSADRIGPVRLTARFH